MKKKFVLFLLPLLLTTLKSELSFASVNFVDVALSEVREMAAKEGKLYFAHFSAEWCMPCQWMEKNTFEDPKLSLYANKNYIAAKLDVDKSEGQWYQNQYSVSTLPTLLIFSSQGVLLNRIETSVEADELLSILEALNKPANKISSRPPALLKKPVNVMDSPKASFVFSRPALVPDAPKKQQEMMLTAVNKPRHGNKTTVKVNKPNIRKENSMQASVSFTPKSGTEYYIQAGVFDGYNKAVEKVRLLEKDFEQPVMIYTKKVDGSMYYHVTIGKFFSKTKAKDFLYFMHRNDVQGVLMAR